MFDPVSAAAAAATSMGGAFLGQRFSESLQHQAQDFNAQQFASRYQVQVADLKKAGLNPMLAYTSGPGSAASVGAASPGRMDNPVAAYNETKLASAQAAKINQETENLKLESKNIEAVQDKLNQEVVRIGNEVMELDQRIKNGQATEQQIKAHTILQQKQQELTELQIELAKQTRNINTPEEIASGTQAAQNAAHISRALKPLIDAINGALHYVAPIPRAPKN